MRPECLIGITNPILAETGGIIGIYALRSPLFWTNGVFAFIFLLLQFTTIFRLHNLAAHQAWNPVNQDIATTDPLISVSGLAKYFERYRKPAHRLWQMAFRGRKTFYEPFWALRDISFTVGKGECLGVIGRNGAGKSTLLQILAGTLRPSAGEVKTSGRVAALLELGSGFNPEYTGRENIWLNAALLGLTESEIAEKFDAIVAFADIGDFISQPVKSYSSGMTLRLAFSVIAHIDADILIIDEALAVGDAYFTQKCMRFMRKFIEEKAVIFVSHDAAAVSSLCTRAMLLENGTIKKTGEPRKVIETYLKDMYEERQGACEDGISTLREQPHCEEFRDMRADLFNSSTLRNDIEVFRFNENSDAFGKHGAIVADARILDSQGRPLNWIVGGEPVTLEAHIRVYKDIYAPIIGFLVRNRFGQHLFGDNTYITYRDKPVYAPAGHMLRVTFEFTMPILETGDYSISIAVAEGTQQDHIQHDWKHEAILFRSLSSSCQTGMMGVPMRNISLNLDQ